MDTHTHTAQSQILNPGSQTKKNSPFTHFIFTCNNIRILKEILFFELTYQAKSILKDHLLTAVITKLPQILILPSPSLG